MGLLSHLIPTSFTNSARNIVSVHLLEDLKCTELADDKPQAPADEAAVEQLQKDFKYKVSITYG